MEMIRTTPLAERPRERLLERGAQALSIRECLAVILGSGPKGVGCMGLAQQIINRPGDGLSLMEEERAFFTAMESSPFGVLTEIPGLGEAHRARLLAAFELGRRYSQYRHRQSTSQRPKFQSDLSSKALEKVLPDQRSDSREWLGFIPYYRNAQLGELCVVERGVRTHVNVDPAEFFARLLVLRPVGFFLCHNHPSGNTDPSPQDFDLTRKVSDLSRQFGIRHLGHWIVSDRGERLIGMEIL